MKPRESFLRKLSTETDRVSSSNRSSSQKNYAWIPIGLLYNQHLEAEPRQGNLPPVYLQQSISSYYYSRETTTYSQLLNVAPSDMLPICDAYLCWRALAQQNLTIFFLQEDWTGKNIHSRSFIHFNFNTNLKFVWDFPLIPFLLLHSRSVHWMFNRIEPHT